MARMTYHEARAILTVCGIDPALDFHALNADKVERLLVHAKARGYKAPRNANGSTARTFHAYVMRAFRKPAA